MTLRTANSLSLSYSKCKGDCGGVLSSKTKIGAVFVHGAVTVGSAQLFIAYLENAHIPISFAMEPLVVRTGAVL